MLHRNMRHQYRGSTAAPARPPVGDHYQLSQVLILNKKKPLNEERP
jgi:hypothetical protein